MGLFPSIFSPASNTSKRILTKPGDKLTAEITKTGKQVIKLRSSEANRSAVRYPKTGTIVETIVYKPTRRK